MEEQPGHEADVAANKLDGFVDFGTAFMQAAANLFTSRFGEAFLTLGEAVGKLLQEGGTLDNTRLCEGLLKGLEAVQFVSKFGVALCRLPVNGFSDKDMGIVEHG